MEALDLLKKDWKKNLNFEQVSEMQIYKMIHKSSSSVVKWIFIISILELIILTSIGIFFDTDNDDKVNKVLEKFNMDTIGIIFDVVGYTMAIIFIFLFYRRFKAISTTDSVKDLMRNILNTRKTVKYYIYCNMGLLVLVFIVVATGFYIFDDNFLKITSHVSTKDNSAEHVNWFFTALAWVTFLLIFGAIFGLLWLYYRLVYGFLTRKLYKNYIELKKIDL